ncbi:hypothetical protein SAMN05216410_1239 [Sanguibacter gelidistatuariae]|uniref:Copper(I)-binding protein n=1 Tax=Sanguibacter gelidistatuariae TaxID=1814289 RepID=A0A1G6HYK4_9MICO|nr:hypothetical protein [Sanguibacter gelidistatuariae]SDB98576.1 hypothetical protein SAMN05216410_1239 [Sanguibacter gelidistatuariae]
MIRQLKKSRAALVVGVVGLGLALSACSPATTNKPYAASDGIRATLGDFTLENLSIVTLGKGEPGQLLGGATNTAFTAGSVTLTSEDGSVNIPVPIKANSTVNFFQDGKELGFIASVPAAPGQNLTVTVTDLDGQSKTVYVPVLDGAWPDYADAVPTQG